MVLHETDNIVCIATRTSNNVKTGNMAQIWILYKHELPTAAIKSGNDVHICGDCAHRKHGSCYVNAGHAPNQVYKAWSHGKYPKGKPRDLMAEDVRFGAYGDPAFMPTKLIKDIAKYANSWTGYTHQWQTCDQDLRHYFMASVDSPVEYQTAKALGWTTFRTVLPKEQMFLNESVCPSPIVTCKQCKKCNGKKQDIVVDVHGPKHKINNYRSLRGIEIEHISTTA